MTEDIKGKNIDASVSISKGANHKSNVEQTQQVEGQEHKSVTGIEALSQYLKADAGIRQGRSIPPLESWHPKQVIDMDLVIKDNGEWWHEGELVTRQSLVTLFATVLWQEKNEDGTIEYFLKTPVQKLRIQVEDVPLLINDVGIVTETVDDQSLTWLEFTTSTGDIVRLDEAHPISLGTYNADKKQTTTEAQVRPYMLVRNGLTALIGRNTFYHLTEIGELTEQADKTILTLTSGGHSYELAMAGSS